MYLNAKCDSLMQNIAWFSVIFFFISVDRNSESPIGADQFEDQDAGHFQKSSCSGNIVYVWVYIY